VVEDDGSERKLSFAAMAARSNQVANWLREQGVRRGDRVLLMLPNRVELWETMLAAIKLGAVLVPTTMLVSSGDLEDRMRRGHVRHVVAQASETPKFAALDGDFTRIAVGAAPDGWRDFGASMQGASSFVPDGVTRASDPLLLYFTSGTTAKPKLVLHSHQSYPVGHLSTMYWIGLQAGDVHWNISSPGWAKHAWSCFFAPWNAGATVFVYNYERFSARACLDTIVRCGVTSLCAPPTVWRMMIKEDLAAWQPPLRELVGAGEPLNPEVIEQVERAWGIRIRDGFGQSETSCLIGNSPGQIVKPGSMGRPLPGFRFALLDIDEQPAGEGEIAIVLDPAPLGLMLGYDGDQAKTEDAMRGGHYHTGDTASIDGDGYYFYVGRNDDVFKSSDYRISPFELESVLIEYPGRAGSGHRAQPRSAAPVGAQGVYRAASRRGADARAGRTDLRVRARAPVGLQAHPPHRIHRAAQDHLRQDPARRTAPRGGGGAAGRRRIQGRGVQWPGRMMLQCQRVFLLDIGLPGMDGKELAQHLRAQAGTADAVPVAVTGYGQESDREQTRAAGFDHHLVEPVDMDSLYAILAKVGDSPG
jgi:acetyl-CoA synthetase